VKDDTEEVRDKVETALADRFTREIYVHEDDAVIIAALGAQYGEQKCNDILAEDVEPVVPDEYECQLAYGFFNDYGTIEVRHPEYVEQVNEQREMMAQTLNEMFSATGGDDDGD